ncbi:hypothetical protein [Cellulomonas septica]|uniref:Integral membrane protein n=1 Tax=Cellulomonas septica TaxID=285080 RepID=A0ABX1K226_9CELL|nr:hypothetical protein [Cellulomonas septica]NKY40306.1 hypothetical protein [Cellulomonas septica]
MSLLRRALVADATLTALSAPTFVLLAPQVAALTGLPVGLVRGAGAFLVVWCGWFFVVLRHEPPRRRQVGVVLVVNTAWVGAGVALASGAAGGLTAAGVTVVLLQAVAVAGLTVAQVVGIRAARTPTTTVRLPRRETDRRSTAPEAPAEVS